MAMIRWMIAGGGQGEHAEDRSPARDAHERFLERSGRRASTALRASAARAVRRAVLSAKERGERITDRNPSDHQPRHGTLDHPQGLAYGWPYRRGGRRTRGLRRSRHARSGRARGRRPLRLWQGAARRSVGALSRPGACNGSHELREGLSRKKAAQARLVHAGGSRRACRRTPTEEAPVILRSAGGCHAPAVIFTAPCTFGFLTPLRHKAGLNLFPHRKQRRRQKPARPRTTAIQGPCQGCARQPIADLKPRLNEGLHKPRRCRGGDSFVSSAGGVPVIGTAGASGASMTLDNGAPGR